MMHKLSKFKLIGGWYGSFPELNEISTGQSHISFLLLLDNEMSPCDVASQTRRAGSVQITLIPFSACRSTSGGTNGLEGQR